MSNEQRIKLRDGKYELVCAENGGKMYALRYGEPWRDLVGDNLIAALAERIQDHEEADASRRALIRDLDIALNGEEGAAKQASLCDIVSQVKSVVNWAGPILPSLDESVSESGAAAAAIQYALSAEEGMAFLRCWNEGNFDSCRREWPDAPATCYLGVDPLLKQEGPRDAGRRAPRQILPESFEGMVKVPVLQNFDHQQPLAGWMYIDKSKLPANDQFHFSIGYQVLEAEGNRVIKADLVCISLQPAAEITQLPEITPEMIREMRAHLPYDVIEQSPMAQWDWQANYLNQALRNPNRPCVCCNVTPSGSIMDEDITHPNQNFVLDLNHDRFARPALIAYAAACQDEYPELASDLYKKAGLPCMPLFKIAYDGPSEALLISAGRVLRIQQLGGPGADMWQTPSDNEELCRQIEALAIGRCEQGGQKENGAATMPVMLEFGDAGSAGPFPIVDGKISLPEVTLNDLAARFGFATTAEVMRKAEALRNTLYAAESQLPDEWRDAAFEWTRGAQDLLDQLRDAMPNINIMCEARSNAGWVGSTYLRVIRQERQDDGSITVVTDHWPMKVELLTNAEAELQKLVEFFRSRDGYRHFGLEGDQMGWSPAETAIKAMRRSIEADTFQYRVGKWMDKCFLQSLYSNMTERGDRLLEEVLELLQSKGYDRARVATLVDYVWSRPAGDPAQEVGGVMVTLAGFCYIAGLDMYRDGEKELDRINMPEIMEKIKRKQEAKNAIHFDTPLPGDAGKEG